MRISAVTETDAHLRLLASRGLVARSGGRVPPLDGARALSAVRGQQRADDHPTSSIPAAWRRASSW
jgi:hypothetical protein